MSEWDGYLEEYLTTPGKCTNACLAMCNPAAPGDATANCLYSAAPAANDQGWSACFSDPQDRPIMQEDGTEKNVWIDEFATIVDALKRDLKAEGPPPNGLWLGGLKYNITTQDREFEHGDYKFLVVDAARIGKKGCTLIATDNTFSQACQICIGFFDEEQGVTKGNMRVALLDFAKYMKEQGL